jgi:hypothetical protein
MPTSESATRSSPGRQRPESEGPKAATESVSVVDDPDLERNSHKSSKRKKKKEKGSKRSSSHSEQDPAGYVSRGGEESYDQDERNPLTVPSADKVSAEKGFEMEVEESELLDDT